LPDRSPTSATVCPPRPRGRLVSAAEGALVGEERRELDAPAPAGSGGAPAGAQRGLAVEELEQTRARGRRALRHPSASPSERIGPISISR
jgi:hypothetical protein